MYPYADKNIIQKFRKDINQKTSGPAFQFNKGVTTVTVMFSTTGVPDVKAKIKDILTESFGEHAIEEVQV